MSYEKKRDYLLNKYPAISDLAVKAKSRMPNVSWSYLETGTGEEHQLNRNIEAFKDITITPRFCKGQLSPDIKTTFCGRGYNAPFGIAPVGLTGLMWPQAELHLAETAQRYNIPVTLSTVATETPETVGPIAKDLGWFQLYTPKEPELCKTILDRAWQSGYKTLVITVDIPAPSRRERSKRAGLTMPPKITPNLIWQGITHPKWTIKTLRRGLPQLRTVSEYANFRSMMSVGAFVEGQMGGNLSWDYCKRIRDQWKGDVFIKGILHPLDAEECINMGADGIAVSNHGGRQFDGSASALELLPSIVSEVNGRCPIIFDSGIRTGLDVLKALHLGADFVLLGRAFIYGVAALGTYGADHVCEIIAGDLKNNMIQLGISSLEEIRTL